VSALGLFGKSAANEAAGRILAALTQAARNPDLYGEGRAPDTLDGRFEVLTAFAAVALLRLKAAPEASRVAQVFTDVLFRHFDAGLREAGVGDLSVAKRMKALAGRFYGRLAAYDAGFGDLSALAAALSRNVWNADAAPFAPALAGRLSGLRDRFAAGPPQALELPGNWAPGA
jgi:cytochrome b pre-mRNA-processing protein 3